MLADLENARQGDGVALVGVVSLGIVVIVDSSQELSLSHQITARWVAAIIEVSGLAACNDRKDTKYF